MVKKRSNETLSEHLSNLVNTLPHFSDDEDELLTKNEVQSSNHYGKAEDSSDDDIGLADFRKKTVQLLDEEDQRYAGERVSRIELESNDDDDDDDDDGDGGDDDDGDDDDDDDDDDHLKEEVEDEDSEIEEIESNEDENRNLNDEEGSIQSSEPDHVKHFADKVVEEIEKGNAVKNQLSIYDSILTCRIKFQKCLSLANQLPLPVRVSKFEEIGSEYKEASKQAKDTVQSLLEKCLELQQVLLEKNTLNHCDVLLPEDNSKNLSEKVSKLHESLKSPRNEIIQKWNDKTRVSQLGRRNFSAFEQSTLQQIENILGDKQRLISRTQTKRSNYHILGEADKDEEPSEKSARYEEIFDDNDFYHQLLRELLERKTTDVTDPVQLGKHWIQLQKARNKMKKAVDTKASKGRKIRYGVHQKLVNFMMPVDNSSWEEEARNELYGSLFGNKGR